MLSLDKTKEPETLKEWLGEQIGLLSWKLDGLTIVLTYQNGELFVYFLLVFFLAFHLLSAYSLIPAIPLLLLLDIFLLEYYLT